MLIRQNRKDIWNCWSNSNSCGHIRGVSGAFSSVIWQQRKWLLVVVHVCVSAFWSRPKLPQFPEHEAKIFYSLLDRMLVYVRITFPCIKFVVIHSRAWNWENNLVTFLFWKWCLKPIHCDCHGGFSCVLTPDFIRATGYAVFCPHASKVVWYSPPCWPVQTVWRHLRWLGHKVAEIQATVNRKRSHSYMYVSIKTYSGILHDKGFHSYAL